MLELYHFGDAICAFKVRTTLAEKGLEWTSNIAVGPRLRDPAYMKLNPKGVVPTLVHDGRVVVESRIISEYLEDAFPDPPLMPADAYGRYQARLWAKQVDDTLHLNIYMLSFVALGGWGMVNASEEDRQRFLPKEPIKRGVSRDLLADGIRSPWVPVAIDRFRQLAVEADAALQQQEWLAGDRFTLADIDIAAYFTRLTQLGLDVLWQDKPAVAAWYGRIRARPSFDAAITRWLTPEENQRYAINAAGVRAAVLERLGMAAEVASAA